MAKRGRPKKVRGPGEEPNVWAIRDVDDRTRRYVKTYALANDLTVAQALRLLVYRAFDRYPLQEELDEMHLTQQLFDRLVGDDMIRAIYGIVAIDHHAGYPIPDEGDSNAAAYKEVADRHR